jgi:methylase of polypeptide subunit release factors
MAEQPYFQRDDEEKQKQHIAKFAKKLLGQIVFLYFLQKKGWLGVKENDAWGTGERYFLQSLFKNAESDGQNYYIEKLQFLFYEALANDRKDQFDPSYYQRFDCKVPFLNGGLFEADYDWQKITIDIPNSIFSNDNKNNAGDKGTGILDVFDRYNFTIKEDEPLEKEVAVDPEMLGKVFENMLEITERKSKGAFYTPREIVHYMCQESLINYLNGEVGEETKPGIPQADLILLVRKGHLALENDQRILDKGRETETYTFKLPATIRKNALLIDDKLANIKICDPAIGSGAFPVGMLHEVINVRQALSPHLQKKTSVYELKKHTIGHSIYGVDIDPSAIDIARLRLWLSLIVDEDDYTSIDALPNLDYKIMQGNSLIEEYEGVKLFDESFLVNEGDTLQEEKTELKKKQITAQRNFFVARNNGDSKLEAQYEAELNDLFKGLKKIERLEKKAEIDKCTQANGLFELVSEARKKAKLLEQLHEEFFDVSSPALKRKLRDQITCLEWELIEATLAEQGKTSALEKLVEYKKSGEKPFFLWKLNFPEIFKKKGGFDIVIGNPPWLALIGKQMQKYKKVDENKNLTYYKKHYCFNSYMPNLYEFFLECSLRSLSENGILCLIIPDRFGYNETNRDLRSLFLNSSRIIDITYKWKFPNIIADTMTILCKKGSFEGYDIRIRNHSEGSDLTYSVEEIMADPEHVFRSFRNDLTKELYMYLRNVCAPLITQAKSTSGFGAKPKMITKSRIDTRQMEVLKGSSIGAWEIKSPFYFDFKVENLGGRTRDKKKLSTKEKVLIRKTGFPLVSSYDDSGRYPEQSLYFFYEISHEINNFYILCLFNSEFYNWFYLCFLVTNIDSTPQLKNKDLDNFPLRVPSKKALAVFSIIAKYILTLQGTEGSLLMPSFYKSLSNALVYELYFPDKIKCAGKEILSHLGGLAPITDIMCDEEKLAIIQREFDRLYDPHHPVRNNMETLDSVEVVRTIREGLKR